MPVNTELQKFNLHNHALHVITDDHGVPWFIAMEVANILEYSDANKMTAKLDDDEVQNRQIGGFGNRGVNIINESGLYSAILTSKKPAAKLFKKWVTAEVLPSIRQTGGYQAHAQQDRLIAQLQAELLKANPLWQDIVALTQAGYSQLRIGTMLGMNRNTIFRGLKQLRECGFNVPKPTGV